MEAERIRREHDRKVRRLIREKVEFKKSKGFKRQNSYLPQMEEFGDMDDADMLKKGAVAMRRSLDPNKKRELFNTKIGDITMHRLTKDIMAASISESMGNTFQKRGPGRSGSKFARQTGMTMGSIEESQKSGIQGKQGIFGET